MAFTVPLSQYSTTRAPLVTDDIRAGYSAGSLWINTSTNQFFICMNAGFGVADWQRVVHPIYDSTALVSDPTDVTKLMRIDVGAVATATTRVLTMPDQDVDLTPGTGTFPALSHNHAAGDITSGTLTVPRGGTGAASTTAYAVLCGGTTGTGALQSIAGLGTSGQVLTSNGAGALPTFQAAGGGGASDWISLTDTPGSITATQFVQGDGAGTALAFGKAVPSGVVVGTTDTQTLTNKTLTAPVFDTSAVFDAEYDNGTKTANFTVDWTNGNKQTVTINVATVTISFTDPPGAGHFTLRMVMGATPPTAITWPAGVKWPRGGTNPVPSASTNDEDIFTFYFTDTGAGTNYYGTHVPDMA